MLHVKRRGRPPKHVVEARKALLTAPEKTDTELLEDVKLRFGMLDRLTRASIINAIRALVVTGAPGVGKTHTILEILENTPGAKFEVVKGTLSAVELYKLGYRMRHPGSVVVLDDADGIFADEDALNILKALCDSSQVRRVNWLKDSATLRQDDVPQAYEFHGSFIFVSNLPLQRLVDEGGNKFVPHFEALLSRSLYLDLLIHNRQAISLWVEHIARNANMFTREGVTTEVGEQILAFLKEHRDDLREFSLRSVMKLCQLSKANPEGWQMMGKVLLCRT